MTTLRTAAQQALEALEREIDTRRCKVSTLRAMNALRAALAEPMEPVAWSHINGTSDTKWHPPQRPAEPVQEPFGYFRAEPFGWTDCADTDDGAIPLYATPQRKPLTEEDIEDLRISIPRTMPFAEALVVYTRAVEAKHGIGGQP